jgi:hypothetical protein
MIPVPLLWEAAMPRGKPFVKGKSGNPRGRPRGIIDKRQRLQKALGVGADAIINVVKSKALEGDMQAAGLVLARTVPTLKPEGSPIRFALDASQETSKQIESVLQALADGQITVEEAKHIAEMVRLLADARSVDGADQSADKLNQAFRRMAQFIAENNDSLPPEQATPEV